MEIHSNGVRNFEKFIKKNLTVNTKRMILTCDSSITIKKHKYRSVVEKKYDDNYTIISYCDGIKIVHGFDKSFREVLDRTISTVTNSFLKNFNIVIINEL